MEFLNQWILVILLVWPLLAAILVFLTKNERMIKWGSVLASLLPLGLSIYMLAGYDYASGGMAYEVNVPWIPAINSSFHLGVDNLSLPLIFLTAVLMTLSLYYSVRVINVRVKEYFGLFHILALSMFGVFVALGLRLVLHFLGDQPGPDVPAHRHLGREEPRVRLDQVLYLHFGRFGSNVVGDPGHLPGYGHL